MRRNRMMAAAAAAGMLLVAACGPDAYTGHHNADGPVVVEQVRFVPPVDPDDIRDRARQVRAEVAERARAAAEETRDRVRDRHDHDDADQGVEDEPPGLDVLASDCTESTLPPHSGFQEAPACVVTSHGEVAAAADNPTLLITAFPAEVEADTPFEIEVSTRNLVRDRFLPAGQGGYYIETGLLNDDGLTRGHFHTACRSLPDPAAAPDPSPAPEFFAAVEDGAGSAAPDTVTITVEAGLPPGTYQCSAWAGDGSHRMPMMERANQTPAFDSVRITVG